MYANIRHIFPHVSHVNHMGIYTEISYISHVNHMGVLCGNLTMTLTFGSCPHVYHTTPLWLPCNSCLATIHLLCGYHIAPMWHMVISIQIPYTALMYGLVGVFLCGCHTAPMWLPYSSHMATIHLLCVYHITPVWYMVILIQLYINHCVW